MAWPTDIPVTQATAANYLQVATTEAVLQPLAEMIDKRVKNYCGRDAWIVTAEDVAEVQDGNGSKALYVKRWPIVSITKIEELQTDRTTWDTITASYYAYNAASGEVRYVDGYVWTKGFQNIKITYKGGAATIAAVSAAVKHGFLLWLAFEWRRYNERAHGKQSISMGDHSLSFDLGPMPAEVAESLANARRYQGLF